MIFFELFSTAFMCVFYGVVIAAAIMSILYFVLKEIDKGIVHTIPFYATGVILFLLLTIQSSLLMAAFEAKGYVDGIETYITQMVEGTTGVVTAVQSQEILDDVISNNHLIGLFFDTCDFSGNEVSDLPHAMAEVFRTNLNSYIWHRVWWSFGIIVVAIFIVYCSRKRVKSSYVTLDSFDNLDNY